MVKISEKTEVRLSMTAIVAIILFLIGSVSAYAISRTNLENKVSHNHVTITNHLKDYQKDRKEFTDFQRQVGEAVISMAKDIEHLRKNSDKR